MANDNCPLGCINCYIDDINLGEDIEEENDMYPLDDDTEREETAIGDFFKNLGGENKTQGRKGRREKLIPKKDDQSKVDNKKLSSVSQINQSNDNSTNFVGGSSAFQLAIQHNNFHYG